jgi:hypothetical protein
MKDTLKKITYKILREKGCSAREAKLALDGWHSFLPVTKVNQRVMVSTCLSTIEHLRDRGRVGTKAYAGRAYFWSHRYRHHLRDASPSIRRRVHDKFLSLGIPLDGDTVRHDEVVNRAFNCTDYNLEKAI